MKIAILNDTHFGARNSSNIFINYQAKFYEEIFFPYLKENNIQQILHLGDYAEHRKFTNVKAVQANREHFLDILVERNIHMDIIPGNHDVYYKNTNNLCSLDNLFNGYENYVSLHHEPTHLNYDGFKIAFIPWICPENYNRCMDFIAKSDAPLCAGHFEFKGFEMYPGMIAEAGMSRKYFTHFPRVISGHYHTKSASENIEYLGAQMEFTWNDASDPKYFHILDTETGDIESIRNPLTLFETMIYDDILYDYKSFDYSQMDDKFIKVIVHEKSDPYLFEVFVENVNRRPIHDLKIKENFNEFRGDSVSNEIKFEETTELIAKYVDEVDTKLDKKEITHQLLELYTEAQMVEYQ